MKRNLDTPMTDLSGAAYTDAATLKDVCFTAVQAIVNGDEKATGKEKLALYALAGKIVKGGVVELTTEDLALIKQRLEKAMPAMVMGKAFELLEQDYVEA